MEPKFVWVNAAWDDERKVWYVDESNVPGLMAEAAELGELQDRLFEAFPDFMDTSNQVQLQLGISVKDIKRSLPDDQPAKQ